MAGSSSGITNWCYFIFRVYGDSAHTYSTRIGTTIISPLPGSSFTGCTAPTLPRFCEWRGKRDSSRQDSRSFEAKKGDPEKNICGNSFGVGVCCSSWLPETIFTQEHSSSFLDRLRRLYPRQIQVMQKKGGNPWLGKVAVVRVGMMRVRDGNLHSIQGNIKVWADSRIQERNFSGFANFGFASDGWSGKKPPGCIYRRKIMWWPREKSIRFSSLWPRRSGSLG